MSKYQISFIHAPEPNYADTQNYGAQFMPVWAYTLASHISQNNQYNIQLFDTRFQSKHSIKKSDVILTDFGLILGGFCEHFGVQNGIKH